MHSTRTSMAQSFGESQRVANRSGYAHSCIRCRSITIFIEDPLTVRYSEAWLHLKRSTRVPLFAGEKVELVEGFRPYLDNGVLDMIIRMWLTPAESRDAEKSHTTRL